MKKIVIFLLSLTLIAKMKASERAPLEQIPIAIGISHAAIDFAAKTGAVLLPRDSGTRGIACIEDTAQSRRYGMPYYTISAHEQPKVSVILRYRDPCTLYVKPTVILEDAIVTPIKEQTEIPPIKHTSWYVSPAELLSMIRRGWAGWR